MKGSGFDRALLPCDPPMHCYNGTAGIGGSKKACELKFIVITVWGLGASCKGSFEKLLPLHNRQSQVKVKQKEKKN